jgi:hypothetical protein
MEYFYKREDVKAKSKYLALAKEWMKEDIILQGIKIVPREEFSYKHNTCDFSDDKSTRRTEKRLCRCLVNFEKAGIQKNCDTCSMNKIHHLAKRVRGEKGLECQFLDFEVPVSPCIDDKIGEIDLILAFDGEIYATEFKPYWNTESVLRMMAEIVTYSAFASESKRFPFPKFKKAILFMDVDIEVQLKHGTEKRKPEQYRQFCEKDYAFGIDDNVRALLKKYEISVFCLSDEGKEYVVKKLW